MRSTNIEGRHLSRGLGVFSIGLGAAGLVAPGHVAEVIGIDPRRRRTRPILRALAARELVNGVGVLAAGPRRALPHWGRVGGSALEAGLLLLAARARRHRHGKRVIAALGVLAATAALGVLAARRAGAH
jgi:hypothetical protein